VARDPPTIGGNRKRDKNSSLHCDFALTPGPILAPQVTYRFSYATKNASIRIRVSVE
jgi:hypothetical protein